MSLHTVEPKTAAQLLVRLTEVERIALRKATPDGVEHMRQTVFSSDGPPSKEAMAEVVSTLSAKFAEYDDTLTMVPSTWKF